MIRYPLLLNRKRLLMSHFEFRLPRKSTDGCTHVTVQGATHTDEEVHILDKTVIKRSEMKTGTGMIG